MPDPEFKEWVSLIKDGLLAIAALVTIGVGIYGARVWKMELIGKEVYAAAIAYASTAQQLAQPPPCETVLPVFVPESFYAWREDAALASTDTALASV